MELLYPLLVLALGILSSGVAWLAIAAIGLALASTVYSYQAQQKAAKDQLKSGGVEITRQDSNAGLTIIYGERAIGGVKVWKDVSRSTFAINSGRTVFGQGDASDGVGKTFQLNAWLNRVDTLGQGPVHSITNIEIEDDSYQAARFRKRNHAIYRGVFMNGSDTQSNLTELSSNSNWKSTSTGKGVAYVYSRFRAGHYSSDNLDRYFSGEPSMRYHVKGKLVWDPRDITQSSSDSSTWTWSDNPALCLLDYLTQPYGRNLDYSQLDISSFEAAADSCDIVVAIPPRETNNTGGPVTTWDPETSSYVTVENGEVLPSYRPFQVGQSKKRLTCNAALDPSTSVLENVKILLQSMRGTLPYHNGTYSLKLEDVEPTSMSFNEDDIIGGLSFSNGDRSKRYNRTTVVFKNRNKRYKEDRVSWPPLGSTEYTTMLAEDNDEELFFEIGLDAVTDYYQAEDLAEFITMSSREQLSAQMQVKSKGMLLEPGDVIEVTHVTPGWSGRKMRVRSVKVNTDQTATLAMTEYNASTYTWRETDNEPVQEDIGLDSPFDDKNPVTSLAATITRVDTASGVPQGQVELTFTAPVGDQVSEYLVRFKPTGTAVWIENKFSALQDEVTNTVTVSFLTPQHDTTYDLEVNYLDTAGVTGEKVVSSFTIPEYRTDLDLDLNTIETEVGEILEREVGGEFIPSDLSDLAYYYKESELTLQGNIDAANATVASNLTNVNASIAATDATVATLQTQVDTNLTTLQAEVDAAESTAASASANLQTQVDGLNTTLGDLTASTADVYLQANAPVAGVSGVPDPIADNSRWYDSDDGNRPYVWDGTQWVDIRDGAIAANSASITALQSTVDDPTTGVSANASALSTLDTTVTAIDGVVTSNSADINNLESTVNDPATGVSATSTAVGNLQTTVTQHGSDISTNATDITNLETTVNDPTTGVSANSTAVSGLDVRVTSAEGSIVSQATDITALESTVDDPTTGVSANASAISGIDTRVTSAEGTLTTAVSDISSLETTVDDPVTGVVANTSAIGGLDTRTTAAEGTIATHTSDITSLENTVFDPSTGVVANTTAISGLDTRVTANEGSISTQSTDITNLETTVNDPSTGVSANSSGLSALTTRVTTAEGSIVTNTSDITALESTVNDPTTGTAATASALSGLETRVTATESVNTSQATDITTLNADLDFRQDIVAEAGGEILDESGNVIGLENDISIMIAASSQADQQLDTRVTSAEQTIESQSTDITSLQSSVTDNANDISGTSTALSALTTRVTTNEGSLTSQASDITQLQADLTSAEGDITATSTALGALTTRVTTTEGVTTANSSSITSLTSDMVAAESDITANASAISGLDTRVTSAEGTITSHSSDITALEATVDNPTTGVSANATAVSTLDVRVTAAEGTLTSTSSDITSLQSQIAPASLVHSSGPIDSIVSALTTITTGLVYNFTPAGDVPLGAGYVHVLIDGADTDDDFRVGYNGSEVGAAQVSSTVNNNAEQWFTFPITSTTGQQTVAVWNLGATAGHVKGIIATYGGVGDPEGMFRGDDNLSAISGNASAISSLDTRVTSAEGTITSQASDITSLESDVGTLQTDVSGNTTSIGGNSTAITGLDTRVTAAEGSITSQAGDITSLESDVGTLQTDVSGNTTSIGGNTTAIGGLTTRVTAAEGTITAQSSDITALESDVGTLQTDVGGNTTAIGGNSTAITGLDTRVTAAEGTLTSQSSDLTSLQSSVTALENADPDAVVFRQAAEPTTGLIEGALWFDTDDNNKLYVYVGTAWVVSDDQRISGNATAITGLDTRVTSAEGTITSQASDITALESTVDDPTTGVSATATAVTGLATRVTSTEGDITDLEAEYYVNLDVDGHVTGVRLYNTGTTSSFTVQASEFKVVAPGSSSTEAAPFAVDTAGTITMNASVEINGNLVVDGTITQTQMGNGSVGGDQIINGSVSADELEISANAGSSGERMFFNGTDNRIEIFDATNVLRVALGDLSGL